MFLHYVIAMGIAVFAIVVGVILGDYGPWYFSWFLGTGFMVLVAAAAGVFFEAQEDAEAGAVAPDVVEVVRDAPAARPDARSETRSETGSEARSEAGPETGA